MVRELLSLQRSGVWAFQALIEATTAERAAAHASGVLVLRLWLVVKSGDGRQSGSPATAGRLRFDQQQQQARARSGPYLGDLPSPTFDLRHSSPLTAPGGDEWRRLEVGGPPLIELLRAAGIVLDVGPLPE